MGFLIGHLSAGEGRGLTKGACTFFIESQSFKNITENIKLLTIF